MTDIKYYNTDCKYGLSVHGNYVEFKLSEFLQKSNQLKKVLIAEVSLDEQVFQLIELFLNKVKEVLVDNQDFVDIINLTYIETCLYKEHRQLKSSEKFELTQEMIDDYRNRMNENTDGVQEISLAQFVDINVGVTYIEFTGKYTLVLTHNKEVDKIYEVSKLKHNVKYPQDILNSVQECLLDNEHILDIYYYIKHFNLSKIYD